MSQQGLEMRHRPETDTDEPKEAEAEERGKTGEKDEESDRRRIDLSVAQVSGSALAAVIAAKLASTLGVYGTIIGAGVISVIATCGGPFFQYVFRRTGEQVRDATAARPRTRRLPLGARAGSARTVSGTLAGPVVGSAPGVPPRLDDPTLLLATVPPPLPEREEFGEATTHGTRVRGWRRPAIAAALVFGVTMGGITAYELVAGEDFGGRQGTTTFGSVVRGGGGGGQDAPGPGGETTPAPSGSSDGTGGPGDGAPSPSGTGATPSPDGRSSGQPDTGRTGAGSPSAEPTPSAPTDGGTTPSPGPTGPTTAPTAPTREPSTGTGPTGGSSAPSAPAPAGPDAGTGPEPGDG
ncbi:hypothetical protein ACFQ67_30875 [Streptomyces sp. NPDC056488]|uniref:hypothetical protein n=1 Tax=unclassified Streptomyces TaxID=2593676 RepID=UPI0036CFC879